MLYSLLYMAIFGVAKLLPKRSFATSKFWPLQAQNQIPAAETAHRSLIIMYQGTHVGGLSIELVVSKKEETCSRFRAGECCQTRLTRLLSHEP